MSRHFGEYQNFIAEEYSELYLETVGESVEGKIPACGIVYVQVVLAKLERDGIESNTHPYEQLFGDSKEDGWTLEEAREYLASGKIARGWE